MSHKKALAIEIYTEFLSGELNENAEFLASLFEKWKHGRSLRPLQQDLV
jgi:hypothetical protein